jgi:hypothetical protein
MPRPIAMTLGKVFERVYSHKPMKRASVVTAILLLTVVGVAQQPSNPPENTANPNDQRYTRP